MTFNIEAVMTNVVKGVFTPVKIITQIPRH